MSARRKVINEGRVPFPKVRTQAALPIGNSSGSTGRVRAPPDDPGSGAPGIRPTRTMRIHGQPGVRCKPLSGHC